MAIYRGERFVNQQLKLSGNEFFNCEFVDCQLIFDASGPIKLDGCRFNSPRFLFDGPAADTLKFLSGIYNSGGDGASKRYVEDVFDIVRKGRI